MKKHLIIICALHIGTSFSSGNQNAAQQAANTVRQNNNRYLDDNASFPQRVMAVTPEQLIAFLQAQNNSNSTGQSRSDISPNN